MLRRAQIQQNSCWLHNLCETAKRPIPSPSKLAEQVLLLLLTNAAGRCDERLHGASGIDGRAAASIGGVAARRGMVGPGASFITLSR